MWRSREDFVKDLAYLNDFSSPGDLEPYEVFYSNGRGTKVKKSSKTPATFTDPRTGEVIDIDKLPLDVEDDRCRSKGRGQLLSGYSSANFQLEKQLRLAKPMGSSDEAIVSYFRRKKFMEHATESDNQSCEIDSKIFTAPIFNSKRTVRACRNSTSQKNAVMDALLSKSENNEKLEESSLGPKM